MLTITRAKEIKGKVAVPHNQDLFFLGAIVAIASGCRTSISPTADSPRTKAWIDALKTYASITREAEANIVEPIEKPSADALSLFYDDIPYRDFTVFLLLGRFGTLIIDSLPTRRLDQWRGFIEKTGCKLRDKDGSQPRRLILEGSNNFHGSDTVIDIDELHCFFGLAMGMRKPLECITESPFMSPLRHLLPSFGFECKVQSLSQKKKEDPLLRRMRFITTGKKSEGPLQFKVTADFTKTPAQQTQLTLPGDHIFSSLVIAAKCLIPRGSLIVENVSLETWNTAFLQLLKNMGAVIGTQETHQCSFGSVGNVIIQKISPFGRKVDCKPRFQFATQLPAMLVVAAFAQGQSVFRHLEDLRNDEPDGIERLNACLSTLGARHGEMPDGIVLEGAKQFDGFDLGTPLPGPIAGAFAVAGLKCQGRTTVADEYILKQWPDFKQLLWSIVEFKE